ncbi:GNAT family N-acetyltransferase [Gemmatirosa kalamazoonensis]|uniref:GNAT family N-acetyltransferase n=1 Tax=Gemmatirosa kalamazoonensis TaxID=861299 RepID=UPI00046D4D58|nr:GNAT family N-acetyltransferase [Gemmatirosa kalamazoonensis]
MTLALLHVRAFQETHGGGPSVAVRQAQWEAILGRADAQDFTFLVEDADGRLVAFARGAPHDGGVPGFGGELNKIYVLRRHQGHGLGRLLVRRVAERFLSLGVRSMLLFGDARSRSNGFYEHLHAERLCSAGGEFHGGYGWRDLATVTVDCGTVGSDAQRDPPTPAA